MSIYGNSLEDRHFEQQLNDWLDKQECEQVDDNIEISQDEAAIFLKVVGNMPSSFDKIVDESMANLFDEEEDYDKIMALWERLHEVINK